MTPTRKISNAIEWLVEALRNNGRAGCVGPSLDEARENLHAALEPLFARESPRCSPDPAPSDSLFRICLALNAEDLDGALKAIDRLTLRDEQFARYADMVEEVTGVKNYGDVEHRLGTWREGNAAAYGALIAVCNALGMAESDRSWAKAVVVINTRKTEIESLRAGNVAMSTQRDLDANAIHLLEMNLADADRRADEAEKTLAAANARIAEIEAQVAAAEARIPPLHAVIADGLRDICRALDVPEGHESWGNALRAIELLRDPPQYHPTIPDGYRHDGATVTNGTIAVEAPGDVLIIRTSAGIAAWAPLDAVKIAITQKEKGK